MNPKDRFRSHMNLALRTMLEACESEFLTLPEYILVDAPSIFEASGFIPVAYQYPDPDSVGKLAQRLKRFLAEK